MILAQGWKTFSHSQRLEQEQILDLRFNGEDTLFVKIFMYLGGRAAVPRARAAMTMPTPRAKRRKMRRTPPASRRSRSTLAWASLLPGLLLELGKSLGFVLELG
jgi:hypothetical protein